MQDGEKISFNYEWNRKFRQDAPAKERWQLYNAKRLIQAVEADDKHTIIGVETFIVGKSQGNQPPVEHEEIRETARLSPREIARAKSKIIFSIWGDFEKEGDVWIADRIIFNKDLDDIKNGEG